MIVDELWGETPPRTASATVQTYVLQLRRLIGCALADEGPRCAKEVLATRFGGYLLNVAPDDVDVNVYGRLARMGQRAFDIGDYESAARLLRSALDTWRGGVLVDVQKGMSLSLEVTRLQESRLSVLETRIDADLQLGRHHSLISELAVLSARHPMNENLCEKYMIALYRSGRQW